MKESDYILATDLRSVIVAHLAHGLIKQEQRPPAGEGGGMTRKELVEKLGFAPTEEQFRRMQGVWVLEYISELENIARKWFAFQAGELVITEAPTRAYPKDSPAKVTYEEFQGRISIEPPLKTKGAENAGDEPVAPEKCEGK